ncbi:MAG: GNAT family N-acetyltransferase [Clostridia bacterium]|nr:GNAT family N-acetyltransferase [Clostridia bacterium]
MEIFNLKDKSEFMEEVVTLEREEWGSSKSVAEKVEKLKEDFHNEYFEKLILVEGEELIGFISIFEYDMEERKDLKPWYATMYVKEEYRGRRIFKDTQ